MNELDRKYERPWLMLHHDENDSNEEINRGTDSNGMSEAYLVSFPRTFCFCLALFTVLAVDVTRTFFSRTRF